MSMRSRGILSLISKAMEYRPEPLLMSLAVRDGASKIKVDGYNRSVAAPDEVIRGPRVTHPPL